MKDCWLVPALHRVQIEDSGLLSFLYLFIGFVVVFVLSVGSLKPGKCATATPSGAGCRGVSEGS